MAGKFEGNLAMAAGGVVPKLDPDLLASTKSLCQWIDRQSSEIKLKSADAALQNLLRDASRHWESSYQACVKLCGFFQHCAKSKDDLLSTWAFSLETTARLYSFYIDGFDNDPNRSMKLVLDAVVLSIVKNPDPKTAKAIQEFVLRTFMQIIVQRSARSKARPGLQSLNTFIDKKAIGLGDVCNAFKELEPSVAHLPDHSLWQALIFKLFSWMDFPNFCPLAGKTIIQLFCVLRESNEAVGIDTLRTWLQCAAAQNPRIVEDIKHYVLKPLFKIDKVASVELLMICNEADPLVFSSGKTLDTDVLLQIGVLELGKKAGLVDEPGGKSNESLVLQESILKDLLSYPSSEIRSSAFSLLVSTQSITKPMPSEVIKLLQAYLAGFYSDFEPKFRNDILAYSKDLIKRCKSVITVAQRALARADRDSTNDISRERNYVNSAQKSRFGPEANLKNMDAAAGLIHGHDAFLTWYLDFLKGELIPTASYQRHVTAAKTIIWMLKINKHGEVIDDEIDLRVAGKICSDTTWVRLLFDLMMDPFDDVREASTNILKIMPSSIVHAKHASHSASLLDLLKHFIEVAHSLASKTGRADYGNGIARSQGLLCSWLGTRQEQMNLVESVLSGLEKKISLAESKLGNAAVESPVHGDFSSLGYIWQVLVGQVYSESELLVLRSVQERVAACGKRIWKAVRHVLCDDSPEGNLPEELEDIEGLDTRDLVSFSFRAVHESSNLLRTLVEAMRRPEEAGIISPTLEVYQFIGNLTFEQLSSLRHRGAFSTVSHTFTTCCQLTQIAKKISESPSGMNDILSAWYEGTLKCINNQASTTRRSAGIPALMTGILSANAESPSFSEIFENLERIGSEPAKVSETDGSNLPQVHALNCIRDIFRSSFLSKKANKYLARTLKLAGRCLKSEIWAIRNCGLMLLRSLVDTLFGTLDSKANVETGWDGSTMRISYDRYHSLPDVLLELFESSGQMMQSGMETSAAEAVFPALDIIRRAGPPESHRDELYAYIRQYLRSRIWHVREIAARTICSFLLQGDWLRNLEGILIWAGNDVNAVHGALMTTKFVFRRKSYLLGNDSAEISQARAMLIRLVLRFEASKMCPEVQAAFLEVDGLLNSIDGKFIARVSLGRSEEAEEVASALLALQRGLRYTREMVYDGNVKALQRFLHALARDDPNTACRVLEALPTMHQCRLGKMWLSGLCELHVDVCLGTKGPELRAQALLNLAIFLDQVLSLQDTGAALDEIRLVQCWREVQQGPINPTLSYAVLVVSGQLMALRVVRADPGLDQAEVDVRSWAGMISESLDAHQSFDTRFAAAKALRSFVSAIGATRVAHPIFLPVLGALYHALNDDDNEVRDVAAEAAGPCFDTPLVAFEAARQLVSWQAAHFGHLTTFHWDVVCRMTGQATARDQDWQPVNELLRDAAQLDEALFAVEKQNLFIEEVREIKRWRAVFLALPLCRSAPPVVRLKDWVEAGLRCLVGLVEEVDDGPLGWMSNQRVFAISAAVLMSATALRRSSGDLGSTVAALLEEFKAKGTQKSCHASLLEMAENE